ncbi:alpha/beta hydrolase [Arthrobacter sp. zg-Y1143]|uniref:alpha/beta fold hydrolase n=1 Tax=Arthrobacter sp. zg-Y1143 TaxID=3049065 RepID=UPI0024C3B501|nr:alpha/beta hydrolase [Arthrobacter sp. zg-Y1143]MDK1329017.1 alpha/beta hydrolase [Arthrobacter sp. zg-Y1143]
MPRERVVFVHGAGSFGAAAWPRQHGLALDYDCLFLRRHGYDAVAEPLPPDLETDIAIIREALGGRGHLVAHSAGAVPAMLAALRDPAGVSSLVLCEPAVFSLTRDLPATTAHRELLQPLFDAAPGLSDAQYQREFVRRVFAAEAAAAPDEAGLRSAARLRLQQPPWDAPLDIVPGVPTLVLTGGWEPLYEEVADFLVSTGAEHRQVGGNHRPQDTDSGAQAIREFLARRHGES